MSDYDAHKDARSDARYWSAADEFAPAQVEPEWLAPEAHEATGEAAAPSCPRCWGMLSEQGRCFECVCWRCAAPLDDSGGCDSCGALNGFRSHELSAWQHQRRTGERNPMEDAA